MSNFLFLFRGGDAGRIEQSPEEMQRHMQKWGAWMGGLKEKGQLVDGLPLAKTGNVVHKSGEVITDGPFAEGSEVVGGYLIVTADNQKGAIEVSKGCPIFEHGGNVEVREIMTMNM
ncbi:YciI family protein [Flavobacteriaceae bacterium F89]|uniref:YciI family protein n=1 Tax=Cerina litoralis TaxID=2874477 RepID=A0AAE3EW34_9FLAO|nr:YciI family protein [Cerina litoralis]MCG2461605.1 YciI family protein [Cerina litoralis]